MAEQPPQRKGLKCRQMNLFIERVNTKITEYYEIGRIATKKLDLNKRGEKQYVNEEIFNVDGLYAYSTISSCGM